MLLRCRHYRLLTLVSEGVRQLLYPLRLLHVYCPVMPTELADYVEVINPPTTIHRLSRRAPSLAGVQTAD